MTARALLTTFVLTLFAMGCCATFGVSPKFAPLVAAPLLVAVVLTIWRSDI